MCIRHLGFITGVNLQPLKMQGHFENGKNQASVFQIVPSSFHSSLNFSWLNLLVFLNLLSGGTIPHTDHLVVSNGLATAGF